MRLTDIERGESAPSGGELALLTQLFSVTPTKFLFVAQTLAQTWRSRSRIAQSVAEVEA